MKNKGDKHKTSSKTVDKLSHISYIKWKWSNIPIRRQIVNWIKRSKDQLHTMYKKPTSNIKK